MARRCSLACSRARPAPSPCRLPAGRGDQEHRHVRQIPGGLGYLAVGGRSEGGIKPCVEFIECEPALREVFTQGRGGRVPVSIADTYVRSWCCVILPGRPGGQVPQHGGVTIQRGPAVMGEGNRGPCSGAAAGLFRPHVPGVVQLAQAADQAAGCQPDHVLQPGDREHVAVGQRRQRRDDPQPGPGRESAGRARRRSWHCLSSTPCLPSALCHKAISLCCAKSRSGSTAAGRAWPDRLSGWQTCGSCSFRAVPGTGRVTRRCCGRYR